MDLARDVFHFVVDVVAVYTLDVLVPFFYKNWPHFLLPPMPNSETMVRWVTFGFFGICIFGHFSTALFFIKLVIVLLISGRFLYKVLKEQRNELGLARETRLTWLQWQKQRLVRSLRLEFGKLLHDHLTHNVVHTTVCFVIALCFGEPLLKSAIGACLLTVASVIWKNVRETSSVKLGVSLLMFWVVICQFLCKDEVFPYWATSNEEPAPGASVEGPAGGSVGVPDGGSVGVPDGEASTAKFNFTSECP